MEFSDMIKRCKLSEISDYLMGFGKSLVEKEDLSYEAAIRKMEYKTEKFIPKVIKIQ